MTSSRTFLVTGASTGIGQATAIALASAGGRVYVTGRSAASGEAAADAVRSASGSPAVWPLAVDLGSLESVRACAASFLERDEPLHVLVNNAGVAGHRGVTADGFELQFGVNHLGHFALTQLLLDRLAASGPDARVVTVASRAHMDAPGIDFGALRRRGSFAGIREYAVSKLCNVLFTQELARRVDPARVTAYALHPGVVASDIWRRVPWPASAIMKRRMIPVEEGAVTSVYCATSPEIAGANGLYYDNCRVREPSRVATPALAEALWKHSAEWTGLG